MSEKLRERERFCVGDRLDVYHWQEAGVMPVAGSEAGEVVRGSEVRLRLVCLPRGSDDLGSRLRPFLQRWVVCLLVCLLDCLIACLLHQQVCLLFLFLFSIRLIKLKESFLKVFLYWILYCLMYNCHLLDKSEHQERKKKRTCKRNENK